MIARVSHMVLPVSDLRKSRDWYVEKLGFVVDRELEGVIGIRDRSGVTIFLQRAVDSLPGAKITLTIEVDDVDGKHAELSRQGVTFVSSPGFQFWGYGAEVLDPDGYTNHLWDEVTMNKAIRDSSARQD